MKGWVSEILLLADEVVVTRAATRESTGSLFRRENNVQLSYPATCITVVVAVAATAAAAMVVTKRKRREEIETIVTTRTNAPGVQ
jgi:hypothetical protein